MGPPSFCPLLLFYSPFPSPLLDDRNWSSPGVRWRAYVISCNYCLLIFLPFIYPIHLFFLLRHYFRLVNSSFCHILVRGGDPILTIIMYICFVHLSFFRGIVNKYVYCVRLVFFKLFPPPHTVNMGLSLEVHGVLVFFW